MTGKRDDLLKGWRTPPAPPHLRGRAMAAARDGARRPVRRRVEDRLWESRAVRYGWLAAASVLLVLNLAVDGATPATVPATNLTVETRPAEDAEVGIAIPRPARDVWTLAEANLVARQILTDPCLDPLTEGDCT